MSRPNRASTRNIFNTCAYLLLFLAGGLLLWIKWDFYEAYYYTSDVFSYSRALTNTLQGKFMWEPSHSFVFGNHAYAILLLFLPFYAFTTSPFILIGSSVFAHLIATTMLSKLACLLTGRCVFGALIGFCYLSSPIVLEQVIMPVYGFQPDVWAAPFIFGALYFNFSGRRRLSLLSLVLLASVKEEFALLSVALVLLLALNAFYTRSHPHLSFSVFAPSELSSSALIKLGIVTVAMSCGSVLILAYGRSTTAFSHAPTPTLDTLIDSISPAALSALWHNFAYFAGSLNFLCLLCPELALAVLPRILVNFHVYDTILPEWLSRGSGWSWGLVTVVNLLFLALVISVKRAAQVLGKAGFLMVPLLMTIVVRNLDAMRSPDLLKFNSAIQIWTETDWSYVKERSRAWRQSVKAARSALNLNATSDRLVLIAAPLFKDFADHDAVVFGFAKNKNPELLSSATAAVLFNGDRDAVETMRSDPRWRVVYTDSDISAFTLKG